MHPSYLKKGDTVGIVAPARKITKEEIQPSLDLIQNWGLKIVSGKNLYHQQDQFSGSDAERLSDMQSMLDDTSVKAIFCARGGYGTLRIIDGLNFSKFKKQPKWIVGYSDITVLHSHIHSNFGMETLHATMPINFLKNEEATETLRKTLFGEDLSYSLESHPLNRIGKAEGKVVGGNLSLIYALAGSRSDIDTKGQLLFIEDLDEYLYHIDRMMISLKRAGKLDKLAGLIVGSMTEMKDNTVPFGKTAEKIIFDAVKEYKYPVCFNFPAGHVDKNMPLFLGRRSNLEVAPDKVIFSQDSLSADN